MDPHRLAAYDQFVQHHIATHGWTLQGVGPGDDGADPFCYTIGLSLRGLPELIVYPTALPDRLTTRLDLFVAMGALLNACASALDTTPAAAHSTTLTVTLDTTPPLESTLTLTPATPTHLEDMTGARRYAPAGFIALNVESAT